MAEKSIVMLVLAGFPQVTHTPKFLHPVVAEAPQKPLIMRPGGAV